jgi:hypothetical protein
MVELSQKPCHNHDLKEMPLTEPSYLSPQATSIRKSLTSTTTLLTST